MNTTNPQPVNEFFQANEALERAKADVQKQAAIGDELFNGIMTNRAQMAEAANESPLLPNEPIPTLADPYERMVGIEQENANIPPQDYGALQQSIAPQQQPMGNLG